MSENPKILSHPPPGDEDLHVDFQYYMFDWDDNILHMPTKIYLERKTKERWEDFPVATSTFAQIRSDTENYRPRNGDWDDAFVEFYDVGRRGEEAFIEDTKTALAPVIEGRETGGPSFRRFHKALIEGRLFAIITARAHASENIRRGVEYFIENILTQGERDHMVKNLRRYNRFFGEEDGHMTDEEVIAKYLDLNRYRGVTSPEFRELVGQDIDSGAESPTRAKQFAIREFVQHVIALVGDRAGDAPVSVGFSDDDANNVAAVQEFIEQELASEYPDVKFVIYDTSDPSVPRGKKIVITGQLELDLDHMPDDA
jgi:hypothetical protein